MRGHAGGARSFIGTRRGAPRGVAGAGEERKVIAGRGAEQRFTENRATPGVRGAEGRPPGSFRAGTAAGANRGFATNRSNQSFAFGGTGRGDRRAPTDISGGWDRGHNHRWGHNWYHWNGNDWVIWGAYPGWGYGDYGSGAPYGYGYETGTPNGYPYGGEAGSLTAEVQAALDQRGFNAGPADGVFGSQTGNAIAAFQQSNGMAPSGQIDPPLLHALGLQ